MTEAPPLLLWAAARCLAPGRAVLLIGPSFEAVSGIAGVAVSELVVVTTDADGAAPPGTTALGAPLRIRADLAERAASKDLVVDPEGALPPEQAARLLRKGGLYLTGVDSAALASLPHRERLSAHAQLGSKSPIKRLPSLVSLFASDEPAGEPVQERALERQLTLVRARAAEERSQLLGALEALDRRLVSALAIRAGEESAEAERLTAAETARALLGLWASLLESLQIEAPGPQPASAEPAVHWASLAALAVLRRVQADAELAAAAASTAARSQRAELRLRAEQGELTRRLEASLASEGRHTREAVEARLAHASIEDEVHRLRQELRGRDARIEGLEEVARGQARLQSLLAEAVEAALAARDEAQAEARMADRSLALLRANLPAASGGEA